LIVPGLADATKSNTSSAAKFRGLVVGDFID
jgi:hypothetical protein